MLENPKRRLAAIDVGSNSVLLAIISCDANGHFSILKEEVKTPRIADYSNPLKRKISLKKLTRVMKGYKKHCERFEVEKILCIGTEALRRNPEKNRIVRYIEKNAGIRINVVSAVKESRLSFLSAAEELGEKTDNLAVVDIGAGSTEITWKTKKGFYAASVRLGSLSLAREGGIEYPLAQEQILRSRDLIRRKLKRVRHSCGRAFLAGVGGTITSIPSILMKLKKYDPKKLDFKKVSKNQLETLIDRLKTRGIEGLKKTAGMPKGRADILLPGLLILSEIMKAYRFSSILVRNRGIRFGMLFDHLRKAYPRARFRMI